MHGEHYQTALLAHIRSHPHAIISQWQVIFIGKLPHYMEDVAACIHVMNYCRHIYYTSILFMQWYGYSRSILKMAEGTGLSPMLSRTGATPCFHVHTWTLEAEWVVLTKQITSFCLWAHLYSALKDFKLRLNESESVKNCWLHAIVLLNIQHLWFYVPFSTFQFSA